MAISIGILRKEWLSVPPNIASDFVIELMEIASWNNYMGGEGRAWKDFSFSRVRDALDEYVAQRGLSDAQRQTIIMWVESWPWIGGPDPDDERYIDLYFED